MHRLRLQRCAVWLPLLVARRSGMHHRYLARRAQQLQLSSKSFKAAGAGGITWLALDPQEHRYLLAACVDSAVAAYDTAQSSSPQPDVEEHAPIFKLERGHPGAHKYVVSCAAWYPVDTGLFITASYDHAVQVRRRQLTHALSS